MNTQYTQPRSTVSTSPELRSDVSETVKKITQHSQDQYKLLEERVNIQHGEILRLHREIGRLKNYIDEMQQKLHRG
jgi:hypothetical protein